MSPPRSAPDRSLEAHSTSVAARPVRGRRRVASWALAAGCVLGGAALLAPGCAIYDDEWTGDCILDCQPAPEEPTCATPTDCLANETCGDDGRCHPGNCRFWGCVEGYACVVTERGTAECVPGDGGEGDGGSGGAGGSGGDGGGAGGDGGAGGGDGGAGGGAVTPCGNPDDCGEGETCGAAGACEPGTCDDVPCVPGFVCGEDGACRHQNAAGCGEDSDCTAEGARCVSGLCTAPADLCFDQVQCPSGSSCVDGKCTAACVDDAGCPESFLCDVERGVCTVPADPCAITADCGGSDRVCVDGACVPRASGTTCPVGEVWVENGCLPEQRASFTCTAEGEQGECAQGLICVRRTCFVSCDPPDQNACAAIPGFEECKEVTGATETHAVCGTSTNLGTDCDPPAGVACDAGELCIDGTCR